MRRIGIDVGGTNTDALLLVDGQVAAAVKTPTTADVTTGIVAALAELAAHPEAARGAIDAVVIGTTHFVNAVLQRRDLARVAGVRIGLPAAASLPPFCDWPRDLADQIRGEVFMLEGGHDYDGRPIVPFDESGMRQVARRIRTSAIRSVASPRSSRRWTLLARNGRGRSSPKSAPTRRSPCRAISAASASWSVRTRPSSMPPSSSSRGLPSQALPKQSRQAAWPLRCI